MTIFRRHNTVLQVNIPPGIILARLYQSCNISANNDVYTNDSAP